MPHVGKRGRWRETAHLLHRVSLRVAQLAQPGDNVAGLESFSVSAAHAGCPYPTDEQKARRPVRWDLLVRVAV